MGEIYVGERYAKPIFYCYHCFTCQVAYRRARMERGWSVLIFCFGLFCLEGCRGLDRKKMDACEIERSWELGDGVV